MIAELRAALLNGDAPCLLSWGVHQGMQGAHWILLHDDGRLQTQHYLPNALVEVETRELGRLPPERFKALVETMLAIPVEEWLPAEAFPDPDGLVTLACVCGEQSWEWSFPAGEIAADSDLAQLGATFRALSTALNEDQQAT